MKFIQIALIEEICSWNVLKSTTSTSMHPKNRDFIDQIHIRLSKRSELCDNMHPAYFQVHLVLHLFQLLFIHWSLRRFMLCCKSFDFVSIKEKRPKLGNPKRYYFFTFHLDADIFLSTVFFSIHRAVSSVNFSFISISTRTHSVWFGLAWLSCNRIASFHRYPPNLYFSLSFALLVVFSALVIPFIFAVLFLCSLRFHSFYLFLSFFN